MKLFQVLQMVDPSLAPARCKLHLAVHNGIEDPLDVYFAEKFDEWQAWQNKKNFERDFVIALISLPQTDRWLFAGAFDREGVRQVKGSGAGRYLYSLSRRGGPEELNGRLVVHLKRTGRASYLRAENCAERATVAEIRAERVRFREFPGYSAAMLTKAQLDTVVRQGAESWRSALKSVAGVYLIADGCNGKLYVGSATAEEGIWNRWCAYSSTGHGGNMELKEVLREKGQQHAESFHFGVLEIVGTEATKDDVLKRESRWKDLLLTRRFGYNRN